MATVRHLEAKSVDDALEMLDLLMSAELVGRARTASDKDKARRHPRLVRASARLAVAVEALFDSDGWGGEGEEPRVSQVWEAIEGVVSRAELRAALEVVTESTPPLDAEDPDWRAALVGRYQVVAPVLKVLPDVIAFGASAEGAFVLAAMRALPDVLAYRSRLKPPLVPRKLIDPGVVPGPWRRLVSGYPEHEDGAVSRHVTRGSPASGVGEGSAGDGVPQVGAAVAVPGDEDAGWPERDRVDGTAFGVGKCGGDLAGFGVPHVSAVASPRVKGLQVEVAAYCHTLRDGGCHVP